MLIINKNVRFSIKLPSLWHIFSILVQQPVVYWIFFCGFFPEQDHHHCCVCQPCCYHCLPRKGRLVALKILCSVFQRGYCRITPRASREKGAGEAWSEPNVSPGPCMSSPQTEFLTATKGQLHPGCAGPSLAIPAGIAYGLCPFNPTPLCSFRWTNNISNTQYW